MIHPSSDMRSIVALAFAAACWGIGIVMTKSVLASVPPITLLFIQLAFSVTLLWTWILFKRRRLPNKRRLLGMGLLGVLNPGISYTLSLLGLTTTTASMSTLLWATEPVLIIGLAWVILREELTLRLILLSVLAIIGVLLISGLATGGVDAGHGFGNVLILAGVLCCALYTILSSRFPSDLDPISDVALQQTFALLFALTLLPLEFGATRPPISSGVGLNVWFWAGMSGIVYYALAFWFYLRGLGHTGASLAGTFINLIPIFGIGGAYLVLGERLSGTQWVGACAILFSVFAIWFRRDPQTVRSPV